MKEENLDEAVEASISDTVELLNEAKQLVTQSEAIEVVAIKMIMHEYLAKFHDSTMAAAGAMEAPKTLQAPMGWQIQSHARWMIEEFFKNQDDMSYHTAITLLCRVESLAWCTGLASRMEINMLRQRYTERLPTNQ